MPRCVFPCGVGGMYIVQFVHPLCGCGEGLSRGRPSANAANSYLEFTACKSQKFGHWANIWPLLEKAKKFTICIGNSAPLRTFFLKNLEKFDYRFFRKQKLSYLAGMSPYISLKIKKRHYEHHMIEAHK